MQPKMNVVPSLESSDPSEDATQSVPNDLPMDEFEVEDTYGRVITEELRTKTASQVAAEEEAHNPEKKHLIIPDYNPVSNLLAKLEAWLILQPEWAIILSQPRATRRAAINQMSKKFLTIPTGKGVR